MGDLIKEFEKLTQTDISNFSLEEQQDFYKNSIRDLDVVICPSSIFIPFFSGKYDFLFVVQNLYNLAGFLPLYTVFLCTSSIIPLFITFVYLFP